MKKYNRLKESSLSRLWKHNIDHDCGAMSAFRKTEDKPIGKGRLLTSNEKTMRSRILKAKLLHLGYGVTQIEGRYPESGHVSKEISFFVVDLHDTGKLLNDLEKLGEDFVQDSILFVPKGAINGTGEKAYLIGTNNSPDNFLSKGEKMLFNKGHIGVDSPIYTSFVNGRPFMFESKIREVTLPETGYGVWSMEVLAKKEIKDLEE